MHPYISLISVGAKFHSLLDKDNWLLLPDNDTLALFSPGTVFPQYKVCSNIYQSFNFLDLRQILAGGFIQLLVCASATDGFCSDSSTNKAKSSNLTCFLSHHRAPVWWPTHNSISFTPSFCHLQRRPEARRWCRISKSTSHPGWFFRRDFGNLFAVDWSTDRGVSELPDGPFRCNRGGGIWRMFFSYRAFWQTTQTALGRVSSSKKRSHLGDNQDEMGFNEETPTKKSRSVKSGDILGVPQLAYGIAIGESLWALGYEGLGLELNNVSVPADVVFSSIGAKFVILHTHQIPMNNVICQLIITVWQIGLQVIKDLTAPPFLPYHPGLQLPCHPLPNQPLSHAWKFQNHWTRLWVASYLELVIIWIDFRELKNTLAAVP